MRLGFSLSFLLLNWLVFNVTTAAIASPETTETQSVKPRFRATFQTGPGAGYESSFGSLYGFVPFAQTPGVRTFYGEGGFNLFTDGGGEAGNLRVGYRRLLPESDVVLGSYLGWDIRNTAANKTFNQLGLGAEALGEKWEARLNGYIPLGDTRQTVGRSFTDTGLIGGETTVSDLRFEQNQLLYSQTTGALFRQQTSTTFSEAAMSGFDIEGGYRLSQWDGGNLFAYAGLYFLDAEERDSVVGVRGRLRAEMDNILAGVSLSSDDEFGTNLQLLFGVQFGGQRKKDRPKDTVVERLGQSVERREIIAIDQQSETIVTTTEIPATTENITVINPETGEPWRFVHVTGGATGGDGSFESPLGQVSEATAIAETTGNDIIYVDAGTNPGMDGFTVPENVQALSTGVSQSINTETFGTIQLLGSDTGTLPIINGATVTDGNGSTGIVVLSNNSTLSGFEVQSSEENGILVTNVSNVFINRNIISTIGKTTNTTTTALRVTATDSNAISDLTITDNEIFTNSINSRGIGFTSTDMGQVRNITVSGNKVTTEGDGTTGNGSQAFLLLTFDDSTIENVSVSQNTFSTEGDTFTFPVAIQATDQSRLQNVNFSQNSMTSQESNIYGVRIRSFSTGIISALTLTGNTISTPGQNARGIEVELFNTSDITNLGFLDNVIEQAGSDSVRIRERGSGTICVSQFTGNQSLNPGVNTTGTSSDLLLRNSIEFAGFSDVATNNTGFDNIDVNTAPSEPASCD